MTVHDLAERRDMEAAGLPRPLIVVLAVKPNLVVALAGEIAPHLGACDVTISIAAADRSRVLGRAAASSSMDPIDR